MIINKFLQQFSEEYKNNDSIENLIEFTNKTLPNDGTAYIFIGCNIIMFDLGFVGPSATREVLYSIVKSGKEKINDTNILSFYQKRINKNKLVSKYLKNIDNDQDLEKHINLILEYLDQFNFDFTSRIKKEYSDKLKNVN